jgi:hypothetical protein
MMTGNQIFVIAFLGVACFAFGYMVAQLVEFNRQTEKMRKRWKEEALESKIRDEVNKQMLDRMVENK